MIEVTCFQCGQTVLISPDVTRCVECGANLRRLIDAEQAVNYFYARALAFADEGNMVHAVQEVQRGITFIPSAELSLLGAILAKRLNRVDQMRQFVAAVAVDSPLRGEAEWLLRTAQGQTYVPEAVPTDADLLPPRLERDRRARAASRPRIQPAAWVLMLALLVLGGWFAWNRLPPDWMDRFEIAASEPGLERGFAPVVAATISPAKATTDTAAPQPVNLPATDDRILPIRLPTPTIAPDLVSAPTAAQAVAAGDPGIAAAAAASQAVNLAQVLRREGRPDLAALPVQARFEGDRLILEGAVESVEQRADLERYARMVPGAAAISVTNVRVSLPATYTVQAGDSLWAISMKLYGAPDMVEEIYAANRNVMSSPGALSVDMVLAVPAKE